MSRRREERLPEALKRELATPDPDDGWELPELPATRGDCAMMSRPCPWVSCRHHLYLEVLPGGTLRISHPDLMPWELKDSCSLDVADRGDHVLEEIAVALNITKERARQIEEPALVRLRLKLNLQENPIAPPPVRTATKKAPSKQEPRSRWANEPEDIEIALTEAAE